MKAAGTRAWVTALAFGMATAMLTDPAAAEAPAPDAVAGIAFAVAPEMGMGVATGTDMDATMQEARATCMESGAWEEDCIPVAWCQPAGWSISLFVMQEGGPHWHEVICGLPERDLAERIAERFCAASERMGWIECLLVQVHDDAGTAQLD